MWEGVEVDTFYLGKGPIGLANWEADSPRYHRELLSDDAGRSACGPPWVAGPCICSTVIIGAPSSRLLTCEMGHGMLETAASSLRLMHRDAYHQGPVQGWPCLAGTHMREVVRIQSEMDEVPRPVCILGGRTNR